MEQTKNKEKRRYPRIRLHIPVHYHFRDSPETSNALSDNISSGGLGVINNSFIPPGTIIIVEISVGSHVIESLGKVSWASPIPHGERYLLGIEFLQMNEINKKSLHAYLDQKKTSSKQD
ncbi:MAG: PilZ domain-containing protein [Candidatus Omnitrophica bacterium]|nr:PilZ domain-containing protein [Candidatus Omnitrophota bacterium]